MKDPEEELTTQLEKGQKNATKPVKPYFGKVIEAVKKQSKESDPKEIAKIVADRLKTIKEVKPKLKLPGFQKYFGMAEKLLENIKGDKVSKSEVQNVDKKLAAELKKINSEMNKKQ